MSLGLALILVAGACRGATQDSGRTDNVTAQVNALASRCGLSGHIAYEVRGNELRLLGVDPRFQHPQFDSCFLTGIEPLNMVFGPVGPRENLFMGPPEARPSDAILDEIEARLKRGSCTGDLGRWWREYAFAWEQGRLNTRTLHFAMHERWPGTEHPGRTIYDSRAAFALSDDAGGAAIGTYDIVTKQNSLAHCGFGGGPLRPQIVP